MTTSSDSFPTPDGALARLAHDRDGDLFAEPVDETSRITYYSGDLPEHADLFQLDAPDPMTPGQLRAHIEACRLVLDEATNPPSRPARLAMHLRPVYRPAGLDVDYTPAEARAWAAAETGAALLERDVALVLTLAMLADDEVIVSRGSILWASDEGVRPWELADHDAVGVLADAGLVEALAVTETGTAALELVRDRIHS